MTALLGSILAKALPWLIAAGGGIAALWAAFARGKASERARQAESRLDDIGEAKAIEDAIAGRPDAKNRKELGKWAR